MDGGKNPNESYSEVLEDGLGLVIPVCGMVKNEKHKTATLLYGEDYKEIDLDKKGPSVTTNPTCAGGSSTVCDWVPWTDKYKVKSTFASEIGND